MARYRAGDKLYIATGGLGVTYGAKVRVLKVYPTFYKVTDGKSEILVEEADLTSVDISMYCTIPQKNISSHLIKKSYYWNEELKRCFYLQEFDINESQLEAIVSGTTGTVLQYVEGECISIPTASRLIQGSEHATENQIDIYHHGLRLYQALLNRE